MTLAILHGAFDFERIIVLLSWVTWAGAVAGMVVLGLPEGRR